MKEGPRKRSEGQTYDQGYTDIDTRTEPGHETVNVTEKGDTEGWVYDSSRR